MKEQDDLQNTFDNKVESYKSGGMSASEAEDRADGDLFSRYAKAPRATYVRWWELLYDLDKNKCIPPPIKPVTS